MSLQADFVQRQTLEALAFLGKREEKETDEDRGKMNVEDFWKESGMHCD